MMEGERLCRLKKEAEDADRERKEAVGAMEAEKERRRQAEDAVTGLNAKLEVSPAVGLPFTNLSRMISHVVSGFQVIVGWARTEEEGRVAAQRSVQGLEDSLAGMRQQYDDAQASLRDKETLIQKLCIDQETLGGKCGELAKVGVGW
jgi:hypothetical protein